VNYLKLIDDRARVSQMPLKNACGVPRQTYCDDFLTIESGKTHFHRERVSKSSRMQAGPSIVSEEKEGSANFTVEFYGSLYNIKVSLCGSMNALDPFVLCRKHH